MSNKQPLVETEMNHKLASYIIFVAQGSYFYN